MASRIDYSQNRKLYVGTTAEINVADGNAVISGKLGIGVTPPVAPLDVFGADVQNGSTPGIKLSSSNTQQTVFAIGNTGTRQYELAVGGTTSSVPGAFYIYDNDAADFRITLATSGNVGINTTSPQVKLQIYGNAMPATGDAASVEDLFTLYRNGSASVWSGGASLALGRYSTGGGSAPKSRLDFKLKNAAGSNTALPETTVMTMQSDGEVIIGSTTLGGNKRLLMLSADNAVNYDIDFQQEGTTDFGRIRYTEGAADLQFFPITGVDPNLTLKYNGSSYFSRGNVGINDTTNNAKLGINGGAVKIKNIVSSSPGSDVRRNINIATFDGQGSTFTGKLIIETPVMTTGAMATFKISGWQYDESWDLTVSGYLRFGSGRGWQQTGGAILTGNPPFDVGEVRLCYNDSTNIFYIILGTATTFWDYYASIVIDADSYYQDSVPTTGWDMSIATADPSGLTSDVTPTVAKYGSSNAIIPSSATIGTTTQGLGKLTVRSSSGVSTFYNNIQCVPSDANTGGLFLGSNVAHDAVIVTGAYYKNAGKYTPTATTASIINLTSGQTRFFGDTGLTVGTEYTPTRNFTLYPGGEVQLNAYDSSNQVSTPTYLLGVRSDGQIVKTVTGATTGTQVHTLAATGGTSSWKKLGTFTAAHGGQSAFIKMVTNNGYNAAISQNVEVYIRFKTSNGGSVDSNGFSGDSSFYTHGPNNAFPAGNIKWVSDAAGTSATSYALYALIPAYSGNGGFYVVENSAGTWVNNMSNASDPGAASSTILIPTEQFRVGSTDFVVNGGGGDAYFANSKVGIGLTSPNTTLSVQGTSSNGINVIGVGTTATRCYLGLNSANKGYLFIAGSSGENPAVITSQGNSYISTNLGIGETSPDQRLNVREDGGSDTFRGIEVHNNSQTDARAGICFKAYDWVQSAIWHGRTGTAAYAGALVLGTNPDTSNLGVGGVTGRMWIVNNGDVGIGALPTYPLDVHKASTSGVIMRVKGIGAQLLIESNTAGEAYLYQKPNITGDKEARFMMTAGTDYGWAWSDDGSGTPASRVKYMKLDQNPGTLTVKGDVIAYGTPSDISLKENIKPIDSALDKVMKLQGVTFDWKKTDSILELKEDIGFIAQDVQKVVPELIRENSNGLLSMRHQGVAPILLEAIKELKAEIDLLKSKPCTCNKCNCNI